MRKSASKIIALLLALTITVMPYTIFADSGTPQGSDSSATAAETQTEPAAEQQVSLMLAGDIMCKGEQQRAYTDGKTCDFSHEFDYVRKTLSSADFAVANLETCVSTSAVMSSELSRQYGVPYLNAPTEFLSAIKGAGFDALVNANNHNCDTGTAGIMETLKAQDEAGLPHTGLFSGNENTKYLMLEKNGIKIGIASYATYYNDSIMDLDLSEQDKYLNAYSEEKVRKDVSDMKAAGADFVIVYYHCGKEYTTSHGYRQETFAGEIANAGADYIICSHSHTVQDYDVIDADDGREVPVFYAAGNFLYRMKQAATRDSIIVSLTISKDSSGKVSVAKASYIPCLILKQNPDTGLAYQMVPCTEAGYKAIKSKTLIKSMKKCRDEIISIVGDKVKPEK